MKILLALIVFLSTNAYAQKASFKEIKLKPNGRFYNINEAGIVYPIIVTTNPQADKLMNTKIKEVMLDLENTKHTARALLLEHIKEYGLLNLSYEITYNKNAILSMFVYTEGCGAYCSSGNTYFNFDLKTGKTIGITDLIAAEELDSFQNLVLHDKIKALQDYKLEEIDGLKQGYIDSSTYNWAIEEVDTNCAKSVSLEYFSLSGGLMEIIDRCEFPHVIQSQQPAYELKYPYLSIQHFLKPKFRSLLK